jgi:membrane-bound lytic murein transglycosylase B
MAASSAPAWAQGKSGFEQWVEAFRARARARGISDATYTRVMSNIKPDTAVFELNRSQPEFKEQVWQYLNRRAPAPWVIPSGCRRSGSMSGSTTIATAG